MPPLKLSPPDRQKTPSATLYTATDEPRIRLEDIPAPQTIPRPHEDDLAAKEAAFIANAAKSVEVRGNAQDIKQRKVFAARIFVLLCAWIVGLFAVLFLQGFQYAMFRLSDNVILALIGGSTVNIIAVFLVVVRYLFPKR